jgi:hypothetical protein
VIEFVLGKHISPIKTQGQLMEVYGDDIMTMQHVIKCCRITKWCDIMMITAMVGSAFQDVKQYKCRCQFWKPSIHRDVYTVLKLSILNVHNTVCKELRYHTMSERARKSIL